MGRKAIAGLLWAAIALSAAPASAALPDGAAYAPHNGHAYHGVSDTGDVADFDAFANEVGAHPAVLQDFFHWRVAADDRGAVSLGSDRHPRRAEPLDRDRRRRGDDHPAPDRQGRGRPLHDPHGGRHRRDRADGLHPSDGGDERPLERVLRLQRRRLGPPPRPLGPLVQARLAPVHADHPRRLARQDQPQARPHGAAADPPGASPRTTRSTRAAPRGSPCRSRSRCRSRGWR